MCLFPHSFLVKDRWLNGSTRYQKGPAHYTPKSNKIIKRENASASADRHCTSPTSEGLDSMEMLRLIGSLEARGCSLESGGGARATGPLWHVGVHRSRNIFTTRDVTRFINFN